MKRSIHHFQRKQHIFNLRSENMQNSIILLFGGIEAIAQDEHSSKDS